MTNKFSGHCRECSDHVLAGEGFLDGKDSEQRWRVLCRDCRFPTPPPPPPRSAPPPWSAPVPSCLRILGLRPPATREAIRASYRALALATHPDRGGDAATFVEVHRAYETALQSFVAAGPSGVGS